MDSEIPGVKGRLSVCQQCFNSCSKTHFNPHLKKNHGVKRNFSQYVFITTGYMIPNVMATFSYLYLDIKPPTPKTTIEGWHTHL